MRLGSRIALALLAFYVLIVATGLWLERGGLLYGPWRAIITTCVITLTFPLALLEPHYKVSLPMLILAPVVNCYLWGYCIGWIFQRRRRH